MIRVEGRPGEDILAGHTDQGGTERIAGEDMDLLVAGPRSSPYYHQGSRSLVEPGPRGPVLDMLEEEPAGRRRREVYPACRPLCGSDGATEC